MKKKAVILAYATPNRKLWENTDDVQLGKRRDIIPAASSRDFPVTPDILTAFPNLKAFKRKKIKT